MIMLRGWMCIHLFVCLFVCCTYLNFIYLSYGNGGVEWEEKRESKSKGESGISLFFLGGVS